MACYKYTAMARRFQLALLMLGGFEKAAQRVASPSGAGLQACLILSRQFSQNAHRTRGAQPRPSGAAGVGWRYNFTKLLPIEMNATQQKSRILIKSLANSTVF